MGKMHQLQQYHFQAQRNERQSSIDHTQQKFQRAFLAHPQRSVVEGNVDTLPAIGPDRSGPNRPVPPGVARAPATLVQQVKLAAPTLPAVARASLGSQLAQPMATGDVELGGPEFLAYRTRTPRKLILRITRKLRIDTVIFTQNVSRTLAVTSEIKRPRWPTDCE